MQIRDRRTLQRLVVIQGVTHRELAEAAGWRSHTYVGRLLRGERSGVRPEAARKIAARLGVEVTDLFYR